MSAVVLLTCTVFVLYLLSVETRASRGVTWASWIPTIWMMIVASRPVSTWLNATQFISTRAVAENNASGSPVNFWILTVLGIAGVVVLFRRRLDWSGTLRRHQWLIVLLTYMLVSICWSEIPLIALKRWVHEQGIAIEMALLVISERNPCRSLASVFRRTAYALLPFSVVLIKYYPAFGRQYSRWSGVEMWTGVTQQKNELGRLCMICVFFLLFTIFERWRARPQSPGRQQLWADLSVIGIGFYLLIGSDSMTSLATLILGVAFFVGLQRFWVVPRVLPQASVVLLLAYGISLPFLGGSPAAALTSALGRDSTLTGRTEVWADVLPAQAQRPLLGYGAGSFWTDARRSLYDIPNAHNGYLDIMLEFGELGLILYAMWLLSCARQLHRALRQHHGWAAFALCLLLMIVLYNSTESAFNSLTEFPTAVIVFVSFAVPTALRSRVSSRNSVSFNLTPGVSGVAEKGKYLVMQ
jgi:exopolysaccharide production protein ExoQ